MFVVAARINKNFAPMIARSPLEKEVSFKIRHDVFATELGLEPENSLKLERNHSDDYAVHCLMTMKSTHLPCGTIRLVSPYNSEQLLPIVEYCSESITNMAYHPKNFPVNEVCEISRLAIPAVFRRRSYDNKSDATAVRITDLGVTNKQVRMFPFISVALYLCVTAIGLSTGKRHFYVMAEPALARSMRKIGIELKQIGDVVEYHGKRAAYYINSDMFFAKVKRPFVWLVRRMVRQLKATPLQYSLSSDAISHFQ